MSTQAQVEANRKNALKSTGPRTAEGKEASSQNATKHGLRTNRNVIKTESQDEFEIYRENMIADLSPDGAMEEMLAERIVSLSWRLKRAEHFQNAVIDALIEHGLHGSSYGLSWSSDCTQRAQEEASSGDMDVLLGIVINKDFANSRTLEQLLVYERRIESSLYRTIAELKKARGMRKEQDEDKGDSWLVARPASLASPRQVTHNSSGESELNISTNEPNFKETTWAEAHHTDAPENGNETNEANLSSPGSRRCDLQTLFF
jgi:hypothetical protein